METLLASIITPSYNQAGYIEDTILSVKNQDYPNIEHLVIDGGSTDDTVDVLKRYDDHLVWLSEPDDGQADAINKGYRLAKGEIIGSWLNSDDTYMAGVVSAVVEYFQNRPEVDWVYGDGYFTNEQGEVLWRVDGQPFDLKKLICEYQYIFQPSVFFRKKVLDDIGFVDASLHMTMDYDFLIRLGLKFKAGYIPQVLATRRLHAEAKTIDRSVEFCADGMATLDKVFANSDLPSEIALSKRLAYSNRHVSCATRCFQAKQYERARCHLSAALKLSPKPFSIRTLKTFFMLIQALFGVQLYHPYERQTRKFQKTYGKVSTNWFRGDE